MKGSNLLSFGLMGEQEIIRKKITIDFRLELVIARRLCSIERQSISTCL